MDEEEYIETPQTKEVKPNWNWRKSHLVFLVLPVLCIIFVPLGGLPYLFGRLSWPLPTAVCMLYPAFGLFMIYCFLASIVRLMTAWKKYDWKGKFINITEVSVPIVFVVLFVLPFLIPIESGLVTRARLFTYGFGDRIRNKADIPATREWLRTLDTKDFSEFGKPLSRDRWPESLRDLKPPSVYLFADNNDLPFVRIVWGGGFFHWGLTIGMEDMEIPLSDLNERYESWLLVAPGVYAFDF